MPPIAAWRNHLRAERINSFWVSHCPMGTVPLLYQMAQAVSRLAKNAQNAMVGQVAPREWHPLSHCLMSHPVFHYFPG